MLAGDDVLAVGRPVRLIQQAERLFRHLFRVTAVARDRPDVVAGSAITRERDPFSVRVVLRLHVPCDSARERARFASSHRDHIEVSEQIEDDLPSVRTDVDRCPGDLRRVDRDFLRRRGHRCVHVPLRFLILFLELLIGEFLLRRLACRVDGRLLLQLFLFPLPLLFVRARLLLLFRRILLHFFFFLLLLLRHR
jgi:hypothetical protein